MKVETFLKRDGWATGPWDDEPDRVEWRYAGLPCLMVRASTSGAWCGYVAVPPGHQWHGKHYDDVDAHAHGGLTYAGGCDGRICHAPEPGEPDAVWWLGFDCAHAGDCLPRLSGLLPASAPSHLERYRDRTFVAFEVEALAEQALKAAGDSETVTPEEGARRLAEATAQQEARRARWKADMKELARAYGLNMEREP